MSSSLLPLLEVSVGVRVIAGIVGFACLVLALLTLLRRRRPAPQGVFVLEVRQVPRAGNAPALLAAGGDAGGENGADDAATRMYRRPARAAAQQASLDAQPTQFIPHRSGRKAYTSGGTEVVWARETQRAHDARLRACRHDEPWTERR